jgi:hypothetical protein
MHSFVGAVLARDKSDSVSDNEVSLSRASPAPTGICDPPEVVTAPGNSD